MIAGLLSNTIITLLNPLFLKYVFDEGVIKKDFHLFIIMSVGFVVIATAWRFFNLFYSLRLQSLKNKILKDITSSMLSKYYRLPYTVVINRDTGYYTSRIYDEPLTSSGAILDLMIDIANAAVSFIVSFCLIAFLSFKSTVILMFSVPFLMFVANRYSVDIKRHSQDEKENEGKLRGFITKALQSYRNVNIFGLVDKVFIHLNLYFDRYISSSFARFKNTCAHNTYGNIFISYGELLVIIVCGYEILRGRMTFGGFMAFMNAFWIAVNGMRSLIQKVPDVSKNNAIIQRMREFESLPENVALPVSVDGRIVFEKVHFKYSDRKVLSDLSFSIEKNEKVMISGKNGSGKSTIANILCGFLSPSNGDRKTLNLSKISACISPYHFIPDSVKDNLNYDNLDEKQKKYLNTLLNDFDLMTSFEKNPEELSAGQKKKVELIMGLMKDADLYLFDEPLANVDVDSKIKIMEHIFDRAKDKTLIVIMHGDEEFQNRFDKIISLS